MAFNLATQIDRTPAVQPEWERPSDWPVITDVLNEVQFLMSDLSLKNTINTTYLDVTGNGASIYIDWGDGTIDTISTTTSTLTTHTYVKGSGTACSRGYTTFKVRVYPEGNTIGGPITGKSARLNGVVKIVGTSTEGSTYLNTSGVLEAYYGPETCQTSMNSWFQGDRTTAGSINFNFLEYVKMQDDIGNEGDRSTLSFNSMFNNCYNLQKVVMPHTMNADVSIDMNGMFSNTKIKNITLPWIGNGIDAIPIATGSSMFSNCQLLNTIDQHATPSYIGINEKTSILTGFITATSMFNGCYSLRSIGVNLRNATAANLFVSGCSNLEFATISEWPISSCNLTSFFNSCTSLETIYWPNTATSTAVLNMTLFLNSCFNLRGVITMPANLTTGPDLQSFFGSCGNITEVIFQSGTTFLNITSMVNMFGNCTSLLKVTLPDNITGTYATNTMFSACSLLQTVTPISGTAGDGVANLDGVINSSTTINSLFINSRSLKSVILPNSMPNLTAAANSFQNCSSLTSVKMPITTGAITSYSSCFSSCVSLIGLTLSSPTNSTGFFSGTIDNTHNLRSLAFINSGFTGATLNLNSPNSQLKEVNLPTFTANSISLLLGKNIEKINLTGRLGSNTVATSMSMTNMPNLKNFNTLSIGSASTTGPLVNFSGTGLNTIPSMTFSCRLSRLQCYGDSTYKIMLQSIRLQNTGTSQWTAGSPQIDISYTDMPYANLVQFFTDIAATGTYTSKNIWITGCTGASSLTAADRLIITSKGWTITG